MVQPTTVALDGGHGVVASARHATAVRSLQKLGLFVILYESAVLFAGRIARPTNRKAY